MKPLIFLGIFIFCSLLFVSTANAQCQGNVYIVSLTEQTGNSVGSYTETELDYCAGLYYDPAVSGNLIEGYGTGNALIGQGYTQGTGSSNPARLDFLYAAPINNLSYTTSGEHYLIAYYLVYVPVWNDYYWYDPWSLGFGFGEIGGGNEIYQAPDYSGYWSYITYWVSSQQYVGSTSHTIAYTGQTQCLPGQQFTTTGQPCASIPECQTGQQFTTTGEQCPNYVPPPEPPAQPVVTVHVFNQPLYPAGIKSKSKNTNAATCITGVPDIAGRTVVLQLINDSSQIDGAGHVEAYHTGPRPLGTLGKTTGITRADGCFVTTYSPPAISGKFKLKATISGITNETEVWVGVSGLSRLTAGENYRLYGGGPEDCNAPFPDCTNDAKYSKYAKPHPSNHWAVTEAIPGLVKIANDYKAQFYGSYIPPDKMVHYNDISLILGGKFDLPRKGMAQPDWLNGTATKNYPHSEHREGRTIDTRVNNIPDDWEEAFIQICRANNFGINDERSGDAPHLHLDWGNPNRRTGGRRSSLMQNGIDQNAAEFESAGQTPSTLVSSIGEAIFERQITQQEYESWYLQLSNAKAQGLSTFLQEVKTFEKQLFASQEYIARQRTNEQFVQDVFVSHLFRDPTDEELVYWIEYLGSLGGNQEIVTNPTETNPERTRTTTPMSKQQRRQIFLNNFQTLPDFVNVVGSVGDDAYQEPPH